MKIVTHNKVKGNKRPGFTLIELLVVISLIILVSGIALPTIMNLFTAGADAQAYNLLSAQLAYARSQAIFRGKYVGVHVQVADRSELARTCYSAVVIGKDISDSAHSADIRFSLLDGCKPEKIPGNMAFGKLTDSYYGAGGNHDGYKGLASNLDTSNGFTTFTIVFSPQGQVVKFVEDAYNGNVVFNDSNLFGIPSSTNTILWEQPGSEPGVTAVTVFDYAKTRALPSSSDSYRVKYIEDNWGQILALNIYTGRFFHRY